MIEKLLASYLEHEKIPISKKYCKKLVASHPDYPSLLSITDTLERFGIPYKVGRIEKEQLCNLEYPYLFWPGMERREPKLVRDRQDVPVNGTPANNGSGEQPIVLKAEPAAEVVDPENKRQRLQARFLRVMVGLLIVGAAGLILLNTIPPLHWLQPSLLFTALAGTAVGYLLVAKDVGINYQPVEAFCEAGGKTGCDVVLRSEGARLIGDVTFSDAAASYFVFQLLAVGFLLPAAPSVVWILAGLGGLAIPVIGYSLWYQAVVAKAWCRLCLLVDGILAVQAGLFGYLFVIGDPTGLSLQVLLQTGLLFIAISSSVLLLKSKIKAANESEQAEIAAQRIKNSPEIFMHLLGRKPRIDAATFEQEIRIGDPAAPVQILMAASLGCGPCKEGFERACRLIDTYPQKVALSIRLRTGGSNGAGEALSPGLYLLHYWQQHIQGKPDAPDRTKKLLEDWYAIMDLHAFRKKYQIEEQETDATVRQLASRHAEWFQQAEIKGTPTFIVNGRKLPQQYRIEDLRGLVPALASQVATENNQT